MNFKEYAGGERERYVLLADYVRGVIQEALKQHKNLRVHLVTCRAKELDSLQKKLEDQGITLDEPIEKRIKDFAGCRVVMLTNSDMDAFHQARILADHFEIIDTNVHHAVPGTETEYRLFDSNNFLIALKPETLTNTQRKQFEGLRCEVQVQTLLNHAWAEMGHDTIYKQPKLEGGLGKKAFEEIEKRMNRVMREHLLPAGHDFDKIARDFAVLMKANEAGKDSEARLKAAKNNNERYEGIETIRDLVVTHYDDFSKQFAELVPTLVDAVEAARATPVEPIRLEWGEYPGNTTEDVARLVSELLTRYKFTIDPVIMFGALLRLHAAASSESEADLWINASKELAAHNHRVWKEYGPAMQGNLLEQIGALSDAGRQSNRWLLTAVLAEILKSEVSGTTSTSDAVTFHQGAVAPSDALRNIRTDALQILERFLDEAEDDRDRRRIIQAMLNATRSPHMSGYGNDLAKHLLDDSAKIFQMIAAKSPAWGLGLRQWCEDQALHVHYRFRQLPPDMAGDEQLVVSQQAFLATINAFREQMDADADFVQFKILVGHDAVRPEAWEGDAFDYEATALWRENALPGIINAITAENVDAWGAKLEGYIAQSGEDGADFIITDRFFADLAAAKPDICLHLIDQNAASLRRFLPSMLGGLMRAQRGHDVDARIGAWTNRAEYLAEIGFFFTKKPEHCDGDLLVDAMKQAAGASNDFAVLQFMTACMKLYEQGQRERCMETFVLGVDYWQSTKQPAWANRLWYGSPQSALIADLDASASRRVLDSFLSTVKIDFHADRILASISKTHPDLAIEFFGRRMQLERGDIGKHFDAVPYHLHYTQKVLALHPNAILDAARQWHRQEPLFFEFRGARLLKLLFPDLPDAILEPLTALARTGPVEDVPFILDTLRVYEGGERIYPICMDIVDRLEPEDKLLDKVATVLEVTGVVRGEFGFVEAHATRKSRLEAYLDDAREKVKQFAAKQIRHHEQSMAWEQRRAERDVEGRRRDWDEA